MDIMSSSVHNEKTLQIYDPRQTDLSKRFSDAFLSFLHGLPCKSAAVNVNSRGDIRKERPLFVICHNFSRIGTDVDDVVKGLQEEGKLNYSMVCIVVFQSMDKHALQSTMPTDVLAGEDYRRYGLLVDIAFSKNIYDCEMNNIARAKVQSFLERFISQPSLNRNTEVAKSSESQGPDDIHGKENSVFSRIKKFLTNSEKQESKKPKTLPLQVETNNQGQTQGDDNAKEDIPEQKNNPERADTNMIDQNVKLTAKQTDEIRYILKEEIIPDLTNKIKSELQAELLVLLKDELRSEIKDYHLRLGKRCNSF